MEELAAVRGGSARVTQIVETMIHSIDQRPALIFFFGHI